MGQSISPSENYLFLNVMVNFVIVNQKLTGSALHIEKNQTINKYCLIFELKCIRSVFFNRKYLPANKFDESICSIVGVRS